MKIVFLCGGIGKRMFPIKKDKVLLEFLGKPLLRHHIESAKNSGFKNFVVIGNPTNMDVIKELCTKTSLSFEFVVQKHPLGMADALLLAKDFISNDEILIVNPDDIFHPSLYKKILEEKKKKEYESFISGYKVASYFPGGYLVTNNDSELLNIIEKPQQGKEPSSLVNIVVHLHTEPKHLLSQIKETTSKKDDIYEKSLAKMVKEGTKMKVVSYHGPWYTIKYPWNILDVAEFFLNKIEKSEISKSSHISNKAVVVGKVVIEEGVKVLENAVINGPCYIGKNTVIGNNSLVRNFSHIGNNCIVGYSTEIKHSYISNNCLFHSNYIGDSVIADNCLFGDRSLTANVRLDKRSIKVMINNSSIDTRRDKFGAIVGENSSIGVGGLLMPGVKVGPSSVVGPGVVLYSDLEPNSMITLKQDYQIKKIKKLN